jgi:K+-sensing histidine kinase KdpD
MTRERSFHFEDLLVQGFISAGVIFLSTLVLWLIGRSTLGEGVIALIYLAPIVWCTIRWGQLAGASASLTAALCYDFFFILPLYTFNIGSLEGWLLLLLFSTVSIVVVRRVQQEILDQRQRERQALNLYELMAAIAHTSSRQAIAKVIADVLQFQYLAPLVQVHLSGLGDQLPVQATAPTGGAVAEGTRPDCNLAILAGPRLLGEISIWKGTIPLPKSDSVMMESFLRQTAMAIERAEAGENNL